MYILTLRLTLSHSLMLNQLEAVVTDTGNIAAEEDSTPQLAFASQIWTYMTSHIMVRIASYNHWSAL